jgi:hypothetical protein
MVGPLPTDYPYRLPKRMYKPAAELLDKHCRATVATISNALSALRLVVSLRRAQSRYYQRKPNKTPEELDSYNRHMDFIHVLEDVTSYLVSLRVRRNLETSVHKAMDAARSAAARASIKLELEQVVLKKSIEKFKSQEEAEKLSNDDEFPC